MNLLKKLFQKSAVKHDIDDELRFHIEQRTAENIAAGMAPEEAAREARKRFGNWQSVREECRELHGASFGEAALKDVRFGIRMLGKSPGFTAVAVLSLALGIGASTAIFSIVNAVLLSALPVPNPQDLRLLHWSGDHFIGHGWWGRVSSDASGHWKGETVSLPVFDELREQCAAQADIFASVPLYTGVTARARHDAVRARGFRVSGNFFSGLGVRPLLGRLLGMEDERASATPAVVISYQWWENQFDRDPGALGQSITLNGFNFIVVGVLPREFAGTTPGEKTELYISLAAIPQLMPDVATHAPPDPWFFWPMARLKPNVNDAEFEAALNVAFARVAGPFMKEPAVRITDGRAGPDDVRGAYRTSLLLLLGVVGVVLLVACANVAGLMLARGAVRQHEFAVRAALGAGRGRLMRQALTESLLIALLGGGLGVLFAIWGKTVALHLIIQRQMNYAPALDQRVLIFTLLATIVAALLSGLWPALRAAGIDPLNGLKEKAALGAPRLRAGRILVAAQIALALLLVAGAGLFVHSLINVAKINPGFATDHLLIVQLAPRNEGYSNTQQIAYFDRVQESLATIPGVRSVALTEMELLEGSREFGFAIPGQSAGQNVDVSIVGERFFATMGIPIILGRELRPGDDEGATKVIVVNQAFVHKYFPDRNPIGLTIEKLNDNESIWQIVGVCRDARYVDLKSEAEPRVHFSFRQYPLRWGASVCLRTALPPLAMATAARAALATVDPNIPVSEIRTEDQLRQDNMSQERMFATLCGSLAVLALLLSCIGLYGLMAYHVSQRTSEIGIRMALGATRRQIAGPILREALLLAGAGGALGLPLALVLNRFIRSSLYDVKPSDPITLGSALVLLVVIGVMSAWLPARRAAQVDPMIALRHE